MTEYILIDERADPPQEVARFAAEGEEEAVIKALACINHTWYALFCRILQYAGYRIEEVV